MIRDGMGIETEAGDLPALIAGAVYQAVRREADAIEQACARAAHNGVYGVLVLVGPTALVAHEHPQVPYGHLYRAPTEAVTDEQFAAAFITWRPVTSSASIRPLP